MPNQEERLVFSQTTAVAYGHPNYDAYLSELSEWCGGDIAMGAESIDHTSILVPSKKGKVAAKVGDTIVKNDEGKFEVRPYEAP